MGALSGEPGRSPVVVSTSSYSSSDGHQPAGVVEQVPDRPGLHGEVEALLLDGGADHDRSIDPGDEVAVPAVDEAPHGPGQTGDPARSPQPQGQALDRPDRGEEPVGDAGQQPGSAPGGDDDGAGGPEPDVPAPPPRSHAAAADLDGVDLLLDDGDPAGPAGAHQRVEDAAVVDLVVLGQVGSASDRREPTAAPIRGTRSP